MKIVLPLLLALLNLACHQKVCVPKLMRQYFITGTYVTWETGSLFRAQDTLIVTRYSTDPTCFQVTRISCFQRTIDAKFYPPAFVNARWIGHYDADNHVLTNTAGTPNLVFAPEDYTVTADNLLYVRVE
jgi:hypothetical protein